MSGGLAKLSQNAQQSFGKIQSDIDKTTKKNNELANSFDNVDRKAKGSSLSIGKWAKGLAVAGALAAAGIVAGGLAFGKDAIGKAMEFGATKKSFEVLTGDPKKGQGLANDLNKLQQDTILGPEVFKNAQTMMGFGIAAEKVIPNLKMLGDVSMGDANKMQSLTLAFSQVSAAGKLTGQDLLQFINAGFNPLNEISKQTGKSIGVLKGEMEKGLVSFSMVENAFKSATAAGGLYNNMLNKLADTPAGKLAQLQGQFESFKVKVGEALMPLATVGLDGLTKMLDVANQVIPYIVEGVNLIKEGFAAINEPTGQWAAYLAIAKSQAAVLWTVIKSLWANIWNIVSGVVEWAGKSELVKDVFWAISQLAEGAFTIVGRIGNLLSWIWDKIIKPFLDGVEWAYKITKDFLGLGGSEVKVTNDSNVFFSKPNDTKVTATQIGKSLANSAPAAAKDSGAGDVAKGITSGGPRVINITVGKMVENVIINAEHGINDGLNNMEQKVTEIFLRILNSGAALQ